MKQISSIAAAVISFAALAACGHQGHNHGEEESEAGHAHEGIVMSHEKAEAAGIVIEHIAPATFHGVIHTSGKVMSASCDETTVVATISGRVSHNGHISEGMTVRPGTNLFTITSAGMQVAEGDPVLRAKIEYEKAERDFHRAEQLVVDKIISEKDFAVAKAEYEAASLTYNSVKKSRSAGGVAVAAPRGGFIKQNLVNEGDFVEAGQPLAVITQNQHLYLRAEVPERKFNELNRIRCAKFKTSYSDKLYDITDMGGHVQSYGRSSEGGNSYIPVIFEFNNTGDVVQGSYAEIFLITADRENVLSVPLTALTEEQGLHYIYIQLEEHDEEEHEHHAHEGHNHEAHNHEGHQHDEHEEDEHEEELRFEKREVTLGPNDGERVEILKGLQGGEHVVVKGAVQVKLASASNAIPAHNHNH